MSPPCLYLRKEGRGKHSQYTALQEPRALNSTPQCRMQPQAGHHVHQKEPAGRGCRGSRICSGHDSPGCSLLPSSGPRGLECLKTVRALVPASPATTQLPACKEEWEPLFPVVCWHFQMDLCMATYVPRLGTWSLSCCTATAARACRGTLWHLNFPWSCAPA